MRAWAVVVVTLAWVDLAHAGPDCVDEARELRAHLTREARRADAWNTLWALGFGAATVGQIAVAQAEVNLLGGPFDAAYREQMYVGSIKAGLGMGARLVFPLRFGVPAPVADACDDARALRAALIVASDKERKSVWLTIIGGTVANLAGSIWLWARHDFTTAITSFAIGVPIGPIGALTQPKASWRLHQRTRVQWTAGLGWVGGVF